MKGWQALPVWRLQSLTRPSLRLTLHVASRFPERLVGLLGTATPPPPDTGLLLKPGGAVHTIGMRFPIDVVYLDSQLMVIACFPHVPPGRCLLGPMRRSLCLEMAAGGSHAIKTGMTFIWEST